MTSTRRRPSTGLPRKTLVAVIITVASTGVAVMISFLVPSDELAAALRGIAAAVLILVGVSVGADYVRLVSARRARAARDRRSLAFRDRFGHASPGDGVGRGFD